MAHSLGFKVPKWAAPPMPGVQRFLVEQDGEGKIAAHDAAAVGKTVVTLGRSSASDIVVQSKSLSRVHAALVFGEAGRVALVDLASKKGTRLAGALLPPNKPAGVELGARIKLGDCSRKFWLAESVPDAAAAPRPAAAGVLAAAGEIAEPTSVGGAPASSQAPPPSSRSSHHPSAPTSDGLPAERPRAASATADADHVAGHAGQPRTSEAPTTGGSLEASEAEAAAVETPAEAEATPGPGDDAAAGPGDVSETAPGGDDAGGAGRAAADDAPDEEEEEAVGDGGDAADDAPDEEDEEAVGDGRAAAAALEGAATALGIPIGRCAVIEGHGKGVTGVEVDAAGARMVTAGGDGALRFWDLHAMDAALEGGREVEVGEGAPIEALAASPACDSFLVVDGTQRPRVLGRDGEERVVFAAGDNYVRDLRNTKGHTAPAACCAWHPTSAGTVVTGGRDGAARMWDLAAGDRALQLKETGVGPGARKSALVRSRLRDSLAQINPFGELYCGAVIPAVAGVRRAAPAAAASSSSRSGAAAAPDELDAAVRGRRSRRRAPASSSSSTAAEPASVAVHALDANTGDAGGGRGRPPVTSVAFSPDGRSLIVGVGTGALQVWDLRSNLALPVQQRSDAHMAGAITFAGFAPGGHGYAMGTRSSGDSCVRLWDSRALERGATLTLRGVATRSASANLCWAGRGRRALLVGMGRGVQGAGSPLLGFDTGSGAMAGGEGAVLDAAEAAAFRVGDWGDVGCERVSWHDALGQVFLGCGDGSVRALWSAELSQRGVRAAVERGVRQHGVAVAAESSMLSSTSMPIYTPNALPMYADEEGPFARRKRSRGGGILDGKPAPSALAVRHPDRPDPVAERREAQERAAGGAQPSGPQPLLRAEGGGAVPMRPGHGAGGDVAPDKSLAQWSRQMGLENAGSRGDDPRAELLRFAATKKVFTRVEGPASFASRTLEDEQAEIDAKAAEKDPKRARRA